MLRLPDPVTGARVEVVPHTRGLVTILVLGADLRVAVLADSVARTARLHGSRVRQVHLVADPEGLSAALSLLNVAPPLALVATYAEALAELGRPVDVLVASDGPSNPTRRGRLPTAPASGPGWPPRHELRCAGVPVLLADLALDGLDPLAARLAVLGTTADSRSQEDSRPREGGRSQEDSLSREGLEQAGAALTRWRRQVAAWAEAPSGALSEQVRADVLAAYDVMDTARALAALRRMAVDAAVSDGTRWETAAWADRLLGLDLARLVGRPQPA